MVINSVLGIPLQKFLKDVRKKDMEEIHELLLEQFKLYKENHEKFLDTANKKAELKARTSLRIIKNLIPIYNKKSIVVFKKTRFEMTYDNEAYLKKYKRKHNGI